ncbi:Glutamate Aspartate periplasmic binding protein precursor GltI [Caenispirillum salinarum AK4]|uniref:Glutamate Aspartate periplasmic binding protein GltI n=1 Tax=Caenispirillum salinarum AK4 TaxID=1238182 RepID=K9HDZ0_9PROT|nr:amino acid ABC transporter substrate-binding protein [Caenispirillum salinarum]EKV26951.1 Glutamate Aspartate periplasmic binding protein precursor GltI [Caenispirillum salinarum AK4]
MKTLYTAAAAAALTVGLGATAAQAGETFDAVKERGELVCGVHTGLAGFSAPDEQGNWSGLDVDVCRAVAAAVFGDSEKVKYVPLSAQQRLTALQAGEVDVLARNTTHTLTRDTANGLNFLPVNYYDGQGFMVRKDLGVDSARQLDGATVCVQTGTTTELNLADYFRANNMQLNPLTIEAFEEVNAAYASGRCDALTSDTSQLAAIRANDLPNPDDHVILPELISKEPLAPAVRHGDDQWFDAVKWVLHAMVDAEEMGITSENVDQVKAETDNPNVKRLLGATPGMGEALGLPNEWAYNVISQVGNYGQSFERNVGQDSPLNLERGLNALWTDGGLQYAPPAR